MCVLIDLFIRFLYYSLFAWVNLSWIHVPSTHPLGTIKNTLGVDFRACDNYKNGFEAAKKIKIPTLSILATDDKMCPVKEGKKLAALIEGSHVDIIDNCGHMMLLEEADRVLKVLKNFVTTNYPAKS